MVSAAPVATGTGGARATGGTGGSGGVGGTGGAGGGTGGTSGTGGTGGQGTAPGGSTSARAPPAPGGATGSTSVRICVGTTPTALVIASTAPPTSRTAESATKKREISDARHGWRRPPARGAIPTLAPRRYGVVLMFEVLLAKSPAIDRSRSLPDR